MQLIKLVSYEWQSMLFEGEDIPKIGRKSENKISLAKGSIKSDLLC